MTDGLIVSVGVEAIATSGFEVRRCEPRERSCQVLRKQSLLDESQPQYVRYIVCPFKSPPSVAEGAKEGSENSVRQHRDGPAVTSQASFYGPSPQHRG